MLDVPKACLAASSLSMPGGKCWNIDDEADGSSKPKVEFCDWKAESNDTDGLLAIALMKGLGSKFMSCMGS